MNLLTQTSRELHIQMLNVLVLDRFKLLHSASTFLKTTNISSFIEVHESSFSYNGILFTKNRGILSIRGVSTSFDITDDDIVRVQSVLTELVNTANYLGLLRISLN